MQNILFNSALKFDAAIRPQYIPSRDITDCQSRGFSQHGDGNLKLWLPTTNRTHQKNTSLGKHSKSVHHCPPSALSGISLQGEPGGYLGGDGSGGRDGGGGGGGHGWEGPNDGDVPENGMFGAIHNAWLARVAMDGNFGFKLGVECFNDACIVIAVNLANRRSRFLREIDFVLCHLAVSILCDISLVWLLAPVPPVSASVASQLGWVARLPQHMFQPGAFTVGQRASAYVYKGGVYGVIGLTMGLLGTGLVHLLTAVREKVDPSFEAPLTEQPLLRSGFTWLLYMALSSNTRYQVVNGVEQVLYTLMPAGPAKALTVGMRLGNNFLGSTNFVWLAKRMDLSQPRLSEQAAYLRSQS